MRKTNRRSDGYNCWIGTRGVFRAGALCLALASCSAIDPSTTSARGGSGGPSSDTAGSTTGAGEVSTGGGGMGGTAGTSIGGTGTEGGGVSTDSGATSTEAGSVGKDAGGMLTSPVAIGDGPGRHPFLYAGEWDTRKPNAQSMFIVREGKIAWQFSIPLHTPSGGIQEFDDATLLSNGNIVFSRMSGAGMVSQDKQIVWEYVAPSGTEIHSCQYLGNDRVLIMRNGNPAQAMIINTATSSTEKTIPIPTTVTGTHGQFRHIRMTKANTILVGHMSEGKVVEYDLEGKVVWQAAAKNPWSAVRLNNGNTLIGGDAAKYVREINPKGDTVWEFTQADVPDIKLFNTQYAMRMLNGNTVITSWVAGDNNTANWPGTVQALEVTPDKKIVWKLSAWNDPDLGPATSIQLLDEPDAPENQQR